ncbi:MAG: hypothetical protein WCQ20_14895 [Synechococcaceae cyanobacterium ELA739]
MIRSHYIGQQGTYLIFSLSSASLQGHTETHFPDAAQWRYSGPPQETHLDGGLVNVTVQLISALA